MIAFYYLKSLSNILKDSGGIMNNKKKLVILVVLGIVFTIMGATISYFTWQSSNEQKTNNFSEGNDENNDHSEGMFEGLTV